MDTQYYSISLASGEHLGFLVTVLDGEDGATATGAALIKLQPGDPAWTHRAESQALLQLAGEQPLLWQALPDGVVLQDGSGLQLARVHDGHFKWQQFVYLINDISSAM